MMDKPAPTDWPILDLLARRWSPRAFSDRLLTVDELRRLFEAARWAPSSNNEQPWHFLIATRDHVEEFERMVQCLTPGNQIWATRVPLLMLSVAALQFEDDGTPNRHAFHDVGLAVENLVIQATGMGLFAHQMAGIAVETIRRTYGIPDGYEPVTAIAVGYPGEPGTLPEKLRRREEHPRERKPIWEFVFEGGWARPSARIKQ